MNTLKKLSVCSIFVFIFLLFVPISHAIAGQLIYDIGAPQVDSTCNEDLANCMSLGKTCQQEKAQIEKAKIEAASSLAAEKEKALILEIALAVVVMFSSVCIVALLKKTSSPSLPSPNNQQVNPIDSSVS